MALEQVWLGLVEDTDSLLNELTGLVSKLILGWRKDFLKDRDELWCQLLHCGIIGIICQTHC